MCVCARLICHVFCIGVSRFPFSGVSFICAVDDVLVKILCEGKHQGKAAACVFCVGRLEYVRVHGGIIRADAHVDTAVKYSVCQNISIIRIKHLSVLMQMRVCARVCVLWNMVRLPALYST